MSGFRRTQARDCLEQAALELAWGDRAKGLQLLALAEGHMFLAGDHYMAADVISVVRRRFERGDDANGWLMFGRAGVEKPRRPGG